MKAADLVPGVIFRQPRSRGPEGWFRVLVVTRARNAFGSVVVVKASPALGREAGTERAEVLDFLPAEELETMARRGDHEEKRPETVQNAPNDSEYEGGLHK